MYAINSLIPSVPSFILSTIIFISHVYSTFPVESRHSCDGLITNMLGFGFGIRNMISKVVRLELGVDFRRIDSSITSRKGGILHITRILKFDVYGHFCGRYIISRPPGLRASVRPRLRYEAQLLIVSNQTAQKASYGLETYDEAL